LIVPNELRREKQFEWTPSEPDAFFPHVNPDLLVETDSLPPPLPPPIIFSKRRRTDDAVVLIGGPSSGLPMNFDRNHVNLALGASKSRAAPPLPPRSLSSQTAAEVSTATTTIVAATTAALDCHR